MNIRNATYHDAPAIKQLLEELGYVSRLSIMVNQIEMMFNTGDHQIFVYELKKEVVGFVSVHYLPQLAFDGGLMLITYLSADKAIPNLDIGRELEQYITHQARLKKCERISSSLHVLKNTYASILYSGYQELGVGLVKPLTKSE